MNGSLLLPRTQLRLGPLLAEGGEGRVYELADRPDQVCKMFRAPQRCADLTELVSWSSALAEQVPSLASRVRASTSWPLAVVIEDQTATAGRAALTGLGEGDPQTAAGLLLPRAPRRFNVLHRDGRAHLATLSYLTADPERRSAAYGISLPPPMGPDRLGLVYALARLLEGFEAASPSVSHGDLSARNVLWSLGRGPEVFVLDCDNGELYGDGQLLGPPERRRAMTPNWDDPSIPAGANPGPVSDRYSLALIFLRICGAAHYPVQKRQKAGEAINLEIGIPPSTRRVRSLADGARLWDLCAQGLSATQPRSRPPAAAWVVELEAVLSELGATRILDAVWAAQGRSRVPPATVTTSPDRDPSGSPAGEVTVRPVPSQVRAAGGIRHPMTASSTRDPDALLAGGWTATRNRAGGIVARGGLGAGLSPAGLSTGAAGPVGHPGSAAPSAWSQLRRLVAGFVAWIVEEHRRTVRCLGTPDRRRQGVLRIPWCLAVDFVVACLLFFFVAMVSSPFLGV